MKFPKRYVPKQLTLKDKIKTIKLLKKTRKDYKNKIYNIRPKINSFKTKKSKHILNAERIYKIKNLKINSLLSKKTGCSLNSLKKIKNKGEGAYFSSGSRPNQTPQSWGYARLASALTSGKSAAIDYGILKTGCSKNSLALKYANKALKKYGNGKRKTPKI